MDILKSINIDAVVADPLLMLGIFLVIVGPIFFIVALWKFIRIKESSHFVVPESAESAKVGDLIQSAEVAPQTDLAPTPSESEPTPFQQPVSQTMPEAPVVSHKPVSPAAPLTSDQTIIMPAGMADVHAQIDILVAQIKQLNKKTIDLEESIEQLAAQVVSKSETHELKDMPANAHDFAQKLLKLAEHVIALEKEVAKLKTQATKAPIMPL